MTIKKLFNIAWKSICVLILYMFLSYLIGIFVEGKADISLWRQGAKDTMGAILGIAIILSGIVIAVEEIDNKK